MPNVTSRPIAILLTVLFGGLMPALSSVCAVLTGRLLGVAIDPGFTLPFLYAQHGFQLVLALLVIFVLQRFVPADYGLHWPRGKTYFGAATVWGIFFAVLMTVVGETPQLLHHSVPDLGYKLTPPTMAGWLAFEGIYVGPTEEIPFRALMVTYLAAALPGRVRFGRYDMHQAGVIIALVFALAHANSFFTDPWYLALAQQVYAFALGVLYAYWLEKSGSIIAPIIGHNVSDGLAYVILFAWVGLS
jgi:hypothetical protein